MKTLGWKRVFTNVLASAALVFGVSFLINAQEEHQEEREAEAGVQESYSFSLMRQNDNITTFETNPLSTYQKAKNIGLGNDIFLSWGGSYRFQYELFENENFDADDPEQSDGWFFHRFLVHTHLKVGKHWSIFAEANSSLSNSKENLTPVDEDELDMNQLFIKYSSENFDLLIGRENLNLGGRRLVDLREGPNVRRSFDIVRANWRKGKWEAIALYAIPVVNQPGSFDNDYLHSDESIWGIYTVKQTHADKGYDLYYLGYHEKEQEYFLDTPENETRHSVGVRWWGKKERWNYNHEALVQFGEYGSSSILGWTLSFNASYQLTEKQILGFKSEVISGDTDPNDDRVETFNPLYPRGAYFGRVARFGPSNLLDIHPYWQLHIKKFMFEIDYDAFWRLSKDDGIYGPAGTTDYAPDGDNRFIAHQFGTLISYEHSTHFAAELETNYIVPGAFLEDAAGDDNLFHLVVTLEAKF